MGRSHVTHGATIAGTCSFSVDESRGEIVKVGMDCRGEPRDIPVIPEILMC